MLDKCANPDCSAVFRRLGTGRLFVADPQARPNRAAERQSARPPHGLRYHWLCANCSKTLTVLCEAGSTATVVPKTQAVRGLAPDVAAQTEPGGEEGGEHVA